MNCDAIPNGNGGLLLFLGLSWRPYLANVLVHLLDLVEILGQFVSVLLRNFAFEEEHHTATYNVVQQRECVSTLKRM